MTTEADDREAARAFFIAYYGPRPKRTSHRQAEAFAAWCRVQAAFLDPEGSKETMTAARESYEKKERGGDPLSGVSYNNLLAAEAAERKADELRRLYQQTLATGELPEYWRGYSARPGARRAAVKFESYLTARASAGSEQASLF